MSCRASRPHRCDEFPAEYSSASCSPAVLASAFSATLMLQPITFVRRANLSERQPGNFLSVSLEGVTARAGNSEGICRELVSETRRPPPTSSSRFVPTIHASSLLRRSSATCQRKITLSLCAWSAGQQHRVLELLQ